MRSWLWSLSPPPYFFSYTQGLYQSGLTKSGSPSTPQPLLPTVRQKLIAPSVTQTWVVFETQVFEIRICDTRYVSCILYCDTKISTVSCICIKILFSCGVLYLVSYNFLKYLTQVCQCQVCMRRCVCGDLYFSYSQILRYTNLLYRYPLSSINQPFSIAPAANLVASKDLAHLQGWADVLRQKFNHQHQEIIIEDVLLNNKFFLNIKAFWQL